jgi:predicted enzyme involved in methoxymalonyl-ACP biosynthesis
VLDQLFAIARDAGMVGLRGRYVPTPKNGLVSKHYEALGFRLTEELPNGTTTWELAVDEHGPSDAPIAKGSPA